MLIYFTKAIIKTYIGLRYIKKINTKFSMKICFVLDQANITDQEGKPHFSKYSLWRWEY